MAWCGVAGRLVALSQWGFTALFAVEAALKVSLLPLVDLQRARMVFDLLLILAMLLAEVLLETLDHAGARWRTTVRVVLSLRLIRLLRTLWHAPHARRVLVSFVTLLPAAAGLLTTTLNFMLFFAAMGIDLYGGGITFDTESGAIISREDAETLRASAFGENGYYPASFNDLPSALMTLFILLVVNDWNVVVSGYVAVWGIKAEAILMLACIWRPSGCL